jgi:hypothetical protein
MTGRGGSRPVGSSCGEATNGFLSERATIQPCPTVWELLICTTTGWAHNDRQCVRDLKPARCMRGIADLPPGWAAGREAVGAAWHRYESETE